MDNHGVLVVGESVADAWHQLYFLERACQVQVLAQSTGSPLLRVPEDVARAHGSAVPAAWAVRPSCSPRCDASSIASIPATTVEAVSELDPHRRRQRLRALSQAAADCDRGDGGAQARRAAAARDRGHADGRLPRAGRAARARRARHVAAARGAARRVRRPRRPGRSAVALRLDGALVPRAARRDRGAHDPPRRLAPARRRVPRVRRRRRGGRRVRARRARPRPERAPRLQRAADRARRADAPRAADAREHPQQRALLGRRGRRPARGADLRHGALLEARADPARRLGPAQARDPAPHADAAAHGRRPGVVAAAGSGDVVVLADHDACPEG